MSSMFVGVITLVIIFLFHSQDMGNGDFGFRVEPIKVDLSQKFPPAIAFELLEQSENLSNKNNLDKLPVIPLTVGYPELGTVELEEMSISFSLNPTSSGDSRTQMSPLIEDNYANSYPAERGFRRSVERDYSPPGDQNIFTEEEKKRLTIAGLDQDSLKEFIPQAAPSLQERVKSLLRNEKKSEPSKVRVEGTPTSDGVLLQGDIEFSREGDLYLSAEHRIVIHRVDEGITKERAQVDLGRGTFSMTVKNPKGLIVGRLTNPQGVVEGEGTLRVADLLSPQRPKLILKKMAPAQSVTTASAYKGYGKDATVFFAGMAQEGNSSADQRSQDRYDKSSEYIAEAQAQKHQSTVAAVNMMSGAELMLMPDKMIKGLLDILIEQDIPVNLDRGDALIWGTVKDKGREVEGATVIAGQGRTSYLGSFYLPDPVRTKTSENGTFVTVVNHPGWNDLYIELMDGRRVHANALVYPGKVTQVVAEIPSETTPITLRSFDAFSGEPVRVQAEIQQMNEIIDTGVSGAVNIEIPKTRTLSFILATPEAPYEKVFMTYTHLLDFLHLPLISKSWLDDLKSRHKINVIPNTGNIIGFVQGDDFIVEVPNKRSSAQTVYFDSQGQYSERGIAGGGFVTFNVEAEQPNLLILSERKQREISRIIKPESEFIQVVNANFE